MRIGGGCDASNEGGGKGGANLGGCIRRLAPAGPAAPGGKSIPGGCPNKPPGAAPGGNPKGFGAPGMGKPWAAAKAGSTPAPSGPTSTPGPSWTPSAAVCSVEAAEGWVLRNFFIQSGMVRSSNVPPDSKVT